MRFDSKIKKVLLSDRIANCAYVYRDGVVIREEAQGMARGLSFQTEIIHIIPFTEEIKFRSNREKPFEGRYVVSNTTLLVDGIKRMEIYFNNTSTTMKEMGISCDTITLTTDSGMKIQEDCFTFMSHDMTLQNDRSMSILDWDTYEYNGRIVWHGDKPEHKEAA